MKRQLSLRTLVRKARAAVKVETDLHRQAALYRDIWLYYHGSRRDCDRPRLIASLQQLLQPDNAEGSTRRTR